MNIRKILKKYSDSFIPDLGKFLLAIKVMVFIFGSIYKFDKMDVLIIILLIPVVINFTIEIYEKYGHNKR